MNDIEQPSQNSNAKRSGSIWLERGIQSMLRRAARHPLVIIVTAILLTIIATWFAAQIGVRANLDELLPRDSKIANLMKEHGQSRATRDWLVLLIEGDSTFDHHSLSILQKAINAIDKFPEVSATVDPFRFLSFARVDGRFRVESIAPKGLAPSDNIKAQEFRQRLLDDPLATNLVISKDGTALGVLFNVPLRSDYRELLTGVDYAIQPLRDLGLKVSIAGMMTIDAAIRDHLTADLPILLAVSLIVILTAYYWSFRSVAFMVLPVIVVGIACVWTVGTMSLLGLDFTIISVTTPPFVMTLGSAYSVHVLTAYTSQDGAYGTNQRLRGNESKFKPIVGLSSIATTVILAGLTTAAGFSGLAVASIPAVREFGLITGLGISYCAILSLLFLPACIQLIPSNYLQSRSSKQQIKVLTELSARVLRHRNIISIIVGLMLVVLSITALGLNYETDFTRFFRGKNTVMDSNLHVQRRLGGFVDFNVTMTIPRDLSEDRVVIDILDPELLQTVANFEHQVKELPGVSWSHSFVSELQRMNKAMTGSYEMPVSRAKILLLARMIAAFGSEGIVLGPSLLDPVRGQLHMNARVFDTQHDTFFLEGRFREFLNDVEKLAHTLLPQDVTVNIWSGSVAALRLTEVLVRDHLVSIGMSLLLVFMTASVGLRSIKLGALSLLPMAIGIVVILAYLSITNTSLDTLTMMFTSVAVGTGVDYAIHVIVRFLQRYSTTDRKDLDRCILDTMVTSGRAIMINTISLSAGLLVLTIASFTPVAKLGALIAVTIFAAAIGSLVVLPAVLHFYNKRSRLSINTN